jgi:hypothetical protein
MLQKLWYKRKSYPPANLGTLCRNWWRNYATSRKAEGLIPDEVTGLPIELTLPAALWHWGLFGLYEKWISGVFLREGEGVRGRRVRLTASHSSASGLSTKCGIFDVWKSYRPSRHVTGKHLLFHLCKAQWSLPHFLDSWLTALRAGRSLGLGRFLVLNSVWGWVDTRDILWLKGLRQLK